MQSPWLPPALRELFVEVVTRLGIRLEPAPSLAELQHFREVRRIIAVRLVRVIALTIGGVLLLWSPIDGLVFGHSAETLSAFRDMRLLLGIGVVLFMASTLLPIYQRFPLAQGLLGGMGLLILVGAVLAPLPHMQGAMFLLWAPMGSVIFPVAFGPRVGITVVLYLSFWAGLLMGDPNLFSQPLAPAASTYLAGVGVIGLGLGHLGYLLTRNNVIQADRLARFNDQLEATVAERTEDVRALARRERTAREEERLWISREIHDELGQELTGLRYAMAALKAGGKLEAEDATMVTGMLDQVQQTVRRILLRLRPTAVANLGLEGALRWLAEDVERRQGPKLSLTLSMLDDVPDEVADVAYHVVQESLTNTMRHAEATRVALAASVVDHVLVIRVADDGKGLPCEPRAGDAPQRLGLLGLAERVSEVGGTARWYVPEDGGTCVEAEIPFEAKEP